MTNPHIARIRTQYETDLANANRTRATALAQLSRAGTAQADIIRGTGYSRETVRKLIGQGLRHMTDGPPPTTRIIRDVCGGACPDAHQYEGGCTLSPMIIGTISPRTEDGITLYSWRCNWDQECGQLRHTGYPDAPAARRAYDRHCSTEHGA